MPGFPKQKKKKGGGKLVEAGEPKSIRGKKEDEGYGPMDGHTQSRCVG